MTIILRSDRTKDDPEEWRSIPDHDGYEVSSWGRVRSVDRWVETKRCMRFRRGVILKAHAKMDAPKLCDRYAALMLGRGRMRRVHQCVAWAFIGPQPAGYYACHDDGDIGNNFAYNIYYGTAQQNQADRIRHGRGVGVNHYNARLNEDDVREIRRRLGDGERQSDVARAFGVTASCISEIKIGIRWSHV